MTAREAPCRQRQTSHHTVLGDGLPRVLGARRCEAACLGQKRRQQSLVSKDQDRDQSAEWTHTRLGPGIAASACRSCPSSAGNGSRRTAGRPITTSAARVGATSRAARYASRNRRRARFRCTARRSWRLTANPTRVGSLDSRQSTMSAGRSIRLPRWKSA
jgi:hypothetical protein